MATYAQTSLQLFQQLLDKGYSKEDRININNAYKVAIKLFAGCYRPSGKTFIAHIVGTASILTSLKVSAQIIAAGLLHSVYTEGDFGTWKTGISKAKRKQMKTLVGEEVEEYLYRYAALQWNRQTILSLRDRLNLIESIDRDVLLIRLADQLEDSLDLGILYCSNSYNRQQFLQNMGDVMVEIAHKIRFSDLAVELEKAFNENIQSQVAEEFIAGNCESRSFFLIPHSCHQKLPILVNHKIASGLKKFFKAEIILE